MASFILGTAGHIDHGKSSLVKALTGVDPDRLAEEKRRGITIELGFAGLDLPSGNHLGIVDVPGHEKFVRQMVAGSVGVDIALLVVAADDGVMVQTREHLLILRLLGVSKLAVALTKVDIVERDWIDLVKADIKTLVETAGYTEIPIVEVSSVTRQGIPELISTLDEVASSCPQKSRTTLFRMPIDRIFTIGGAGTVVTGTVWTGDVSEGDSVELVRSGLTARVRSIQVHGEPASTASSGNRVALNLAGVDKDESLRGDMLATPSRVNPTTIVNTWFEYTGRSTGNKDLESGARVHVHHGTSVCTGRILLIGSNKLSQGERCFVQVRLDEPLCALPHDRFIVRSYSPVYTIGGGVILDTTPRKTSTPAESEIAVLVALRDGDIVSAVNGVLDRIGVIATSTQLSRSFGLEKASVAKILNESSFIRIKVEPEMLYFSEETYQHEYVRLEDILLAFHQNNPSSTDMSLAALRDSMGARVPAKFFDYLVEKLAADKKIAIGQGNVRHNSAASTAVALEKQLIAEVTPLLESQGLSPSNVAELATALSTDVKILARLLAKHVAEGKLVRLAGEYYFTAEAIELAQKLIKDYLTTHEGATTAELRDALGVSRKYAVWLLEHFDAAGLTRRDGDMRYLRG